MVEFLVLSSRKTGPTVRLVLRKGIGVRQQHVVDRRPGPVCAGLVKHGDGGGLFVAVVFVVVRGTWNDQLLLLLRIVAIMPCNRGFFRKKKSRGVRISRFLFLPNTVRCRPTPEEQEHYRAATTAAAAQPHEGKVLCSSPCRKGTPRLLDGATAPLAAPFMMATAHLRIILKDFPSSTQTELYLFLLYDS